MINMSNFNICVRNLVQKDIFWWETIQKRNTQDSTVDTFVVITIKGFMNST